LLSEDAEAVDAALEIKACLATSETSKALTTCDRMRSLHPENKLFEGLRLEIENKERETRLEFVRRLSADLEKETDLDSRIQAIQQAINRYPAESQLSELLRNATARRDLFHSLIAEARHDELSDRFGDSLKCWSMLLELYPAMPGLETEVHRVEALVDTQRRMRRRAEFVDTIFGLSSTGDYARATFQCINALAEYPNDAGLLALKASIEEKAQHATDIQRYVSEGLTFLQAHELEAALETFAKARNLDQNNLQVRYLIGIALVEKARDMMSDDRRKLSLLLEEARNFIPNPTALPSMSPDSEDIPPQMAQLPVQEEPVPPVPTPEPENISLPPIETANEPPAAREPFVANPSPPPRSFLRVVLFALFVIGTSIIGWVLYASTQSSANAPSEATSIPQFTPVLEETSPPIAEAATEPELLDVHFVTDQPAGTVWVDDQLKGEVSNGAITLSGIEPGVRAVTMNTPAGEIAMTFEFSKGAMPIPKALPGREIANVLFVASTGERSRVECNCAPAGLRVGEVAERISSAGLELPLLEGEHRAELWVGKNRRDLTIYGGRSPVVTIAVFSVPPINESVSKVGE
jgi:tetratricopeptide (TPR) repeat protein